MDRREKLALGSLAVGAVALAFKALASWLTGSVALFSDALGGVVTVGSAAAAFYALRVSGQPADDDHPYGHSKAEYASAVVEGVLIVLAAILILREVYGAVLVPPALQAPGPGLAAAALAGGFNAAWAFWLIRDGRRLRSSAVVADGLRLVTEVTISLAVLAGVTAAAVAEAALLDPALAALVALAILWSGSRVVRASLGGLMDQAAPPEVLGRIREAIAVNADGAIEAHDLRTRHAGRATFVDFHLVVPGALSVSDAHDICDRLERAIRAEIDGALITIHVEPENKAKHAGIVVL